MKILFLSPRQCLPLQSGAKLREYHFLRALAAHGDVTYVYCTSAAEPRLTRDDLPFCEEVVAVPKPATYTRTKLARGILGSTPLTLLNYHSAEMERTVLRLLAAQHFDVIHADSVHLQLVAAAAAAQSSSSTLVYDWHNIESEALSRYADTATSRARRWYARMTAAKLAAVERSMLASPAAHVVCSEREQHLLLQENPRARILVAANGVDSTYFNADETRYDAAVRLVFVGSMDYLPNADGMVSFVATVWPSILAKYPAATLSIVGSNPSTAVKELASQQGVTVTGTVPDVRPYYRAALAAIAPLRTGGGTRLKILESMAMGTPTITSPIGAEGLAITPGTHVLFADPDTPQAWVAAIDSLVESPAEWSRLAHSARQLIESRYDWNSIGQSLAETYAVWSA